jgi:hypothetical protein
MKPAAPAVAEVAAVEAAVVGVGHSARPSSGPQSGGLQRLGPALDERHGQHRRDRPAPACGRSRPSAARSSGTCSSTWLAMMTSKRPAGRSIAAMSRVSHSGRDVGGDGTRATGPIAARSHGSAAKCRTRAAPAVASRSSHSFRSRWRGRESQAGTRPGLVAHRGEAARASRRPGRAPAPLRPAGREMRARAITRKASAAAISAPRCGAGPGGRRPTSHAPSVHPRLGRDAGEGRCRPRRRGQRLGHTRR